MRLREYSEKIPKPMVPIGYRPILWHVMKYYAHFGYKDFILCLGHQGDVIRDYFVNYKEYISNDFVLKAGSTKLLGKDIDDWKITFVDTGIASNVAERLLAIKEHVKEDDFFLANYSDGLTDLHLPTMIERFKTLNKIALIMTTKPARGFHLAAFDHDNTVTEISTFKDQKNQWINAGYFVFGKNIFDFIDVSDDLPAKTFPILSKLNQLAAFPYEGIFLTMDTFSEKEELDEMYTNGDTPWQVWKNQGPISKSVEDLETEKYKSKIQVFIKRFLCLLSFLFCLEISHLKISHYSFSFFLDKLSRELNFNLSFLSLIVCLVETACSIGLVRSWS